MYNVIDIGSSSIKASIYEQISNNSYHEKIFTTNDIRLLNQDSYITSQIQKNALEILQKLLTIGKKNNAIKNICIATCAMRSAVNADSFIISTKQTLNLPIHVLTGIQEATLIAHAIQQLENVHSFFSFDIGGGSVEFNILDKNLLIYSSSKNIGTINIKQHLQRNYLLNSFANIQDFCLENIKEIYTNFNLIEYPLICTGGSLLIAKKILGKNKDNKLSYREIYELYQKIQNMNISERINFGIPSGKSDIFDIALAIVLIMLQLTSRQYITISLANVRHGVVLHHKCF